MKQEPQQDSRHNMRKMYAQAMHDQKEQLKVLPAIQIIAEPNVICRFMSYGGELIDFVGEPIYYKVNGIYGYLCLCGSKIVHFCSDADGQLFYDEPNGWSVLNGS